jgi:hypothetical protein
MSDFNYIEYLKNNPLFKKPTTKSTSLIKESQEPVKTKTTKSSLKAKIREEILATLKEEEDYERMSREVEYGIGGPDTSNYDEEIDMEDLFADLEGDFEDMPMDFEPIDEAKEDEEEAPEEEAPEEEMDAEVDVDVEAAPAQGLSAEEQEIQNSLKIAYDNAVAMGDQKLANQIGNSITFFTRTHVVER